MDAGVSVIFQEFNLNPHATIYDNIFLGREDMKNGLVGRTREIAEARRLLERMEMPLDPCMDVRHLSTAQKQVVEICKALSPEAKVIVFDEPTASITDKETALLFKIIRQLRSEGVGIVYISHRLEEIFEICDRCTIMRDGCSVATFDVAGVTKDRLTELMVGRTVQFTRNINPHVKADETALSVRNLTYKDRVKNVSFELKRGQVLGFSGLVGAGRTELMKCIAGAYDYKEGSVTLEDGTTLRPHSIQNSLDHGIVYLSEDRKDEGLILINSLSENIALPNLKKLFGRKPISKRRISSFAAEYVKRLRVRTSSLELEARNLSGGNQQKVVIAKWLGFNANIYIFDEPTRGIDVGARAEIYNIMNELLEQGASIILVSSDLVEILKMSDKIMVMREGELTAVLDNTDDLTQADVMRHAM